MNEESLLSRNDMPLSSGEDGFCGVRSLVRVLKGEVIVGVQLEMGDSEPTGFSGGGGKQ